MKRALTIFFTLCFFYPCGVAFSQQLGNPTSQIKKGVFKLGLQGTVVYKKRFENFTVNRVFADGTSTTQSEKSTVFEDDIFSMLTVTYGLTDRINLFVTSGVASGGSWLFDGVDPVWEAELKSCFVWGGGVQGTIFQIGDGWRIGLGVQYLRYDDRDVHNWKEMGTGQRAEDLGWKTHDEIDYWQMEVVASLYRNMGSFTPYIGVGYDYSHIHVTGNWAHSSSSTSYEDDASFSNDNKVGVWVGFDMGIGENFTASLQGTFVSSTAVTLGVGYKL
jgi:outer membrane protein W